MAIVFFVLVFGIIVISHEFGHFILAKKNGIRVVEFAIGMGPKLFGFKRKGTEYVVRLLPIGGACVFDGEDGREVVSDKAENDTDEEAVSEEKLSEEKADVIIRDEGKTFPEAPVWGRIATVVAGPLFNFILAFLLALIIVWNSGSDRPVINGVMEGYPAMEAGIQKGDVITKMNGETIHLAREIYINTYLNKDKAMTVTYERDGKENTVTIKPKYNEAEDRYLIGLDGYGEYVDCKNGNLLPYSYYEVRYSLKATIKSLGMLVTGNASKDDVSGPIGIAQVIGEVSEQAAPYGMGVVILNMLNIAMLLSVNLGVLNLLPLPALDGGRLVFLLIEAVRGKPVPPEKEGMVHFAGFVVLMILMVFVVYNDIMRLIG